MHKITITLGLLLGLAACGGPAEDEILPGNWEMSAGMTDFEVPGASPDQAAMFAEMSNSVATQEQCVTEAETKFDPNEMGEAFGQGGDCTMGEFDLSGGNIAGSMSCQMPDGSTSDVAITGTLAPESFSMKATTEVLQDALPGGKANVTIEVKGKRIGDC